MKQLQQEFWRLANTGLRNPLRMIDGLRVYVQSPLFRHIHGKPNEIALEELLIKEGLMTRSSKKKSDGTSGRKWRKAWNNYGAVVICVNGRYDPDDHTDQGGIGYVDDITPLGKKFIDATTYEAVQECFLRALSAYIVPVPEINDMYFSPLRWTLAVLLAIEKCTGKPDVSFVEFAACIQTSFPYYDTPEEVAHRILNLRQRKAQSSAKKLFDGREYERIKAETGYKLDVNNFCEYGDMNLRNLRASGIFVRRGRGIGIAPQHHSTAVELAKAITSTDSQHDRLIALYQGFSLPTDDIAGAKAELLDIENTLKAEKIAFTPIDESHLNDVQDYHTFTYKLQNLLNSVGEKRFADMQQEQWQEIVEYMRLIEHNGGTHVFGNGNEIRVERSECAEMLEWVIWRSLLAIDSLSNEPSQVRSFRIDQDFFPVNTAPGNMPDLLAEYPAYVVVGEVTMSSNSRQEAMEGEPVRRHVVAVQEKYVPKETYGLFIAVKVDINTIETFRHGIWYMPDETATKVHIIPLSLLQYRTLFTYMFQKGHTSPDFLIDVLKQCWLTADSSTAPDWRHHIDTIIRDICR
jgi:hypothetical protein